MGKRIQTARERLPDMTQGVLGARFGISDKAVSSWERDKTKPDVNKLEELRQILRVTFAWLVAGEDDPPDPNDPAVSWDDQIAAKWRAARERNRPTPTQKARRR